MCYASGYNCNDRSTGVIMFFRPVVGKTSHPPGGWSLTQWDFKPPICLRRQHFGWAAFISIRGRPKHITPKDVPQVLSKCIVILEKKGKDVSFCDKYETLSSLSEHNVGSRDREECHCTFQRLWALHYRPPMPDRVGR